MEKERRKWWGFEACLLSNTELQQHSPFLLFLAVSLLYTQMLLAKNIFHFALNTNPLIPVPRSEPHGLIPNLNLTSYNPGPAVLNHLIIKT